MRIELTVPREIDSAAPLDEYHEALDDVTSILADVCLAIEDQGEGSLLVAGFGQQWPVDVGTDLPVMLEQLPALICAVEAHVPAELDFYEQGIQRRLVFTPVDDGYEVLCQSWSDWQPNPGMELIGQANLLAMLSAVRDSFMTLVRNSYPGLAEHPWVAEWLRGEPPR